MKSFYFFSYYALYKVFKWLYKSDSQPEDTARLFLVLILTFFFQIMGLAIILKWKIESVLDDVYVILLGFAGCFILSYIIHGNLLKKNRNGKNKIAEYSKKTYGKWQYILTSLVVILFPFLPFIALVIIKNIGELFL